MKTVVNEPQAEYKIAGWQTESVRFSFDELIICGIENETVVLCPPSVSAFMIFSEEPKIKLSSLRGRLSKQNNKEIEDQVSHLRSEWDRNT